MIAAKPPVDEADRLADLTAIRLLDTPPEERFDRITRLAAEVLDVPIAFLALIDSDRQWFKSKCGLTRSATGRDISFCGHAILQSDAMIVPDARLDERFHDNPLVVGDPYIRFYAGHPIKGPTGQNVGTFCIAAPEPRNIDVRQRSLFAELAAVAQHELLMLDVLDLQQTLLGTQRALLESQRQLVEELQEAARYIESRLPVRLTGPVASDWCFVSSSQLGGDFFDHLWLSDTLLSCYLLDVCGHGVGACLLSASIQDALRSRTLGNCDFRSPAEVVASLNRAFCMEDHGDRFFTIWYGVFDTASRRLEYSSGGHHAAILFEPGAAAPRWLDSAGMAVGVASDCDYETGACDVPPGSRLYLFSDGVFEVSLPHGGQLGLDALADLLGSVQSAPKGRVEKTRLAVESSQESTRFLDDFSLLELEFDGKKP